MHKIECFFLILLLRHIKAFNSNIQKHSTMSALASTNQNQIQEEPELEIIYGNSFFIPHVFDYISLNDLVFLIENSTIGIVEKIESIPKINQTDGHNYYSCFVFMKEWMNNDFSQEIQNKLFENSQSRIYYTNIYKNGNPEYIVILPNKSSTTQKENPKHIDLTLFLHTDVRLETIQSVMEGLDLGKIKYIEFIENNSLFTTTNTWKHANLDIWNKHAGFRYNTVNIRFEYWYKTNTAYEFQNELFTSSFVDIPVFDRTVWSFYELPPLFQSYNPYVWYSLV